MFFLLVTGPCINNYISIDNNMYCIVICRGVASGGKRVTECIGPSGLGARDRLAIGNTRTFHSNSGPNTKMKETSPILGAVFKLQHMRNHIKQILQKCEAALPDASTSRASKQSGISFPHSAALLPRSIRDKQRKSLDTFRCDTELLYSRVIWERLVMLAENSHDNEVYWKTLIGLSIQHHSNLTLSY